METTALTLPDEAKFKADIQAINKFQEIAHANLVEGQDYGVIPGTSKPTLLKPGAEKITKLLGLCDHYNILDRQEDWKAPFFRYLIKCQLRTASDDLVVSEGFGECNSMESKYRYRWLWPKEVPENFDKKQAITRKVAARNGPVTQYRIENDDIYTQVNTIIKMAKKRALVDAALSAGRLSNIFTQDVEDIDEVKASPKTPQEKETQEPSDTKINIDLDWLKESLGKIGWTNADAALWIKGHYKNVKGENLKAMIGSLTEKQQEELTKEIQTQLDKVTAGDESGS